MPLIEYIPKQFKESTLQTIEIVNSIIDEYAAQGYDLTLRQVYYQLVSRGLIANKDSEYDRLGSIVNDGRLAGMIDWERIVDRTRNVHRLSHWESPSEIMFGAAHSYRLDKWEGQEYRVECWIEKDALKGVFQRICDELDIPLFSCRGYTSQSEMWVAGQRMIEYIHAGQTPVVLHFGDHDPSGIDMSRDIEARLNLFLNHEFPYGDSDFVMERLALNIDQVNQYNPPPNPAKITDSRAKGYIANFGYTSWELDALEPSVLSQLVRDNVAFFRDDDTYNEIVMRENQQKESLVKIARNFLQVSEFTKKL